MASITIDDAELRELVSEHAQRAAAEYLVSRVIPEYPHYFLEGKWIVTYDWLKYYVDTRVADLEIRLRRELTRKPWYKRWLGL